MYNVVHFLFRLIDCFLRHANPSSVILYLKVRESRLYFLKDFGRFYSFFALNPIEYE